MITVAVSGTKLEAIEQLNKQTDDATLQRVLSALIDRAPGNRVSLTASMSADAANRFGQVSITGSFWTE